MKKYLLALLCLALPTLVYAQPPVVQQSERIGWDYTDADFASGAVTRFEVQWDGGAWTDVGIPVNQAAITGGKSYFVSLPAMTPGDHTVAVRACNTTTCSEPTPALTFTLTVVPKPPANLRVDKGGL